MGKSHHVGIYCRIFEGKKWGSVSASSLTKRRQLWKPSYGYLAVLYIILCILYPSEILHNKKFKIISKS